MNIKKFFITSVCILVGVTQSYALCTDPEYTIDNVCTDATCFETYPYSGIQLDSNTFVLQNASDNIFSNFSTYFKGKLNTYKNIYRNTSVTIHNYCVDTKGKKSCNDKNLTLENLLDINNKFTTEEKTSSSCVMFCSKKYVEYNNGTEYFLRKTVDEIPYKLNKVDPLIINYRYSTSQGDILEYKNICNTGECLNSSKQEFQIYDTSPIHILTGVKSPFNFSEFDQPTFFQDDFSYDKTSFIAGGGLNLFFKFSDSFPISGCSPVKYNYKISYKYEGDNTEEEFISQNIFYNSSGDRIGNEELDIISERKKGKIEILVREPVSLSKAGKVIFYISISDFSGNTIKEQLNFAPIDVYAGVPVENQSTFEVLNYDPIIAYGKNSGYYPLDTFTLKATLKDKFGNTYTETNKGIDISYAGDFSEDVRLYDVGVNDFVDSNISGIQSDAGTKDYYFRITFDQDRFYANAFNFKVKLRNSQNAYTGEFTEIRLEDFDNKFYIKDITQSNDFEINCGKGPITLTTQCTSDNFSGCDPDGDESVTFSDMSENGTVGFLKIIDKAYNRKSLAYGFDHLDYVSPEVTVMNNITEGGLKALGEPLRLQISDSTSIICSLQDNIHYSVLLNGVNISSGTMNGTTGILSLENDILTKTGEKNIQIDLSDAFGNTTTKKLHYSIFPSDIDQFNSSITRSSLGDKYANNEDFYMYTLELKDQFGNVIYDKELSLINQDASYYVSGGKTITTDMVNYTGSDAILESYSGKTDANGKINILVKSLVPGEFTEIFKVEMDFWNNNYSDISSSQSVYIGSSSENAFKKPFVGELYVSNDGSFTDGAIPEIGTEQSYVMKVLPKSNILEGKIGAIIGNQGFIASVDGHILKDFVGSSTQIFDTTMQKFPKFSTRIDAFNNILKAPGIETNRLEISYILGGKSIKYTLTKNDEANDQTEIGIMSTVDEDSLGLRIIGTLQGGGKSEQTGQSENFSDLSKSELRQSIRKNAYQFIKEMKSGSVAGGIKYIEGDYELLSSESGYETLIVKNGNVTIGGNINKNIGIIVLKDNFNVYTDYEKEGNIYIKPNVGYIKSFMYADGGAISADDNGDPIVYDSDLRRSILMNQLIIEGILFTRNTIGGSVLGDIGTYTLPGGQQTEIFNRAMVYDLNYIRTGSENLMNSYNKGFKNPTIIIYNPEIQINPPKGFVQ